MADLQKTVEIIFGGRNDLSKVIGEVDRSLSALNDASQPFANMADNVLRAETAVVALGIAFAGLSINEAGKFGDQFAEISTLTDKSVADLGEYRKEILDYATDSTQSLESITGAVYSAISAGVDYSDALGIMSQAEQLAVAGKADLNSTLVALASTMNAYGASTDQAADYSDVFFTTVKLGQTTIPELAASLAQVTSIAAAAGVPFDDLSAAIAALTASGMPTTQAITSIKGALSNILKPSADAQKVAAELGIEFNATALKTQGLGVFMEGLQTATGGNVETMARLFGSTEALSAVLSLTADTSGKFARALEQMELRTGATAKAFAAMVDNFAFNNEKLANNIKVVLIGVGTKLLDEYGDVIKSLIANLQGIGTAIDAGSLDGLIGIFEAAMKDISNLMSGIAKVLPEALAGINWSGLSGSFDNLKKSLGDAFAAVFGDIDLSTVEGVKDAIQTVVKLFEGLTNLGAGVVDGMRPLFIFLGTVAEKFGEMDEKGQLAAGTILGVGKSVSEISGFLSGATSAVSGLTNALLLLGGSNILSTLTSLVSKIGPLGLAGATSGLGSALATFAFPTALVTAAGVALVGAAEGYLSWQEAEREAAAAEGRAADSAQALADKYTTISEKTGVVVTNTKELKEALNDGTLQVSKFNGELVNNEQYLAQFEQDVRASADASWMLSDVVPEVYKNLKELGIVLDSTGTKVGHTSDEFNKLESYYIALGNSPEIAYAMTKIETETKRIPKAVEKAKEAVAKESEALIIELTKIASDERLKAMEIAVGFNVEKTKADAAVMVSTIESVANSITSTGSLLDGLSDNLNDYAGSDRRRIGDLMDNEEDRRQDAFDLQKKLTNAQIDLTTQRANALRNGDALIKINGDGLAPELEAFMWKILETIQIRAAEDQSQFLLGI